MCISIWLARSHVPPQVHLQIDAERHVAISPPDHHQRAPHRLSRRPGGIALVSLPHIIRLYFEITFKFAEIIGAPMQGRLETCRPLRVLRFCMRGLMFQRRCTCKSMQNGVLPSRHLTITTEPPTDFQGGLAASLWHCPRTSFGCTSK